jgi:hypothetical protein
VIEAIVSYRFDQIRFCILDFGRIDAQPLYESILHNIFRVCLATKQIVSDVVQHRLVESNSLSLVQNSSLFNLAKVDSFNTK